MSTIYKVYRIIDLSSPIKRKHLLEEENQEGLIKLISQDFQKPLFRLFIKEEELPLLEDNVTTLKLNIFKHEDKYRLGDFLITIEEEGSL